MEASSMKNEESNVPSSNNVQKMPGKIPLIFTLLFFISIIVYLFTENHFLEIAFAHLGGFCILGILGSIASIIATKKGYTYSKVLSLVVILPILLGAIPVILFKPMSCGGSISLAVAILMVLFYSIAKPKAANNALE